MKRSHEMQRPDETVGAVPAIEDGSMGGQVPAVLAHVGYPTLGFFFCHGGFSFHFKMGNSSIRAAAKAASGMLAKIIITIPFIGFLLF